MTRLCVICHEPFKSERAYWTHLCPGNPNTTCMHKHQMVALGFERQDTGWVTWEEIHAHKWDINRMYWSSIIPFDDVLDDMIPTVKPMYLSTLDKFMGLLLKKRNLKSKMRFSPTRIDEADYNNL